ncbi:MAG: aldehyde ferredoxin oxidoreductase [Methanosarcinales archaeon]|nr:MAG: aldehyde ferredoxin oxidoreductase [Methanosarcinales archaeon]
MLIRKRVKIQEITMTIKGGYCQKILEMDLSKNKKHVIEVSDNFAVKYVGGRGWGARIIWENLEQIKDPLSPSNIVVIAPGPLSGLYLPASGKTSFSSISPATGLYADSNMGGMFAVEIKQAGYDAIIIRGRAEKLSYLFIDDDCVELKSAKKYKGLGCTETERHLKEDLGDETLRIATIGPAGENLVKFSCINSEWSRNAGRTGMGAIFGSKNLKAIVIRGTKDLPVFDLTRLVELGEHAYKTLKSHRLFEFWQRQGLMTVVDYANAAGIMPTHNFKDTCFDDADKINGEVMETFYKIGDTACYACPMTCGNVNLVKEGKYAGTVTEGPEYETACMFGSNVGINDFAAVLRANYLCDEYGVDTISTGNLIAAVIEAYEKGILTLDELGGMALHWGDSDSIMELIRKIGKREGIGNVIAEGSYGLIKKWPAIKQLISQVKGLEQSSYDVRSAITMALSYGTSDIGGHHARAWTIAKELEVGSDWTLDEKAEIVIYQQTVRPLFDMLGVCRLPWVELGFSESAYAEFYSAATGIETGLEELLKRSEAVYNITRAINIKLGATIKDDFPSWRCFNEPIKTGPLAGKKLEMEEYTKILQLYYNKRGWNENGVPLPKTLDRLELTDIEI